MFPCARCRNLFVADNLWPCNVCGEMVCSNCLYATEVDFKVLGYQVKDFPMYVCSLHLLQPEPEVMQ